jgi:hypothetical protein
MPSGEPSVRRLDERPPTEAALLRLRCDAVAPVAAEHFDERFGSDGRQLAQLRHLSVAILALADFPDLLGHPARLRAKPVGTMKIDSVRLTAKDRPSEPAD